MIEILTFWRRQITLGTAIILATGCGSTGFDTIQLFSVQIQGVHKAPDGAAGDSSPKKIAANFIALKLVQDDGTEIDLSPTEAQEIEIINRPELFYQSDLKDYDGLSFSSAHVVFEPNVEVTGRYKIRPMELTTYTFSVTSDFTVSDSQGQLMKIDVHWLKTAYTDPDAYDEVFTEPSFVTSIEND
jgi:hypothetical protein